MRITEQTMRSTMVTGNGTTIEMAENVAFGILKPIKEGKDHFNAVTVTQDMIGVAEQPELSYVRKHWVSEMETVMGNRTVTPENSIGVYIVHCFTSVI